MSDVDNDPLTTRRQALRRIALFGVAAFVAPSVLTISDAEAGRRGSPNKSDRPCKDNENDNNDDNDNDGRNSQGKHNSKNKRDCKERKERECKEKRKRDCKKKEKHPCKPPCNPPQSLARLRQRKPLLSGIPIANHSSTPTAA
jgi:hypothetical protein